MSEQRIRVVLVDDHPSLWDGLRADLERAGVAEVVGEAASGAEAIDVVRDTEPDVVLMDLRLPGVSGIDAIRRIAERSPQTQILVLSMSADEADVLEAVKAGASGYLVRTSTAEAIGDAVRRVAAGEVVITPELLVGVVRSEFRRARANHQQDPFLTMHRNILRLVVRGLPLETFVVARLNSGAGRAQVIGELKERGIAASDAAAYIDALLETAEHQRPSTVGLMLGALGGLAGALLGAVAWGYVTTWTGWEIGLFATAVGLLTGFGAVLLSGGKRGSVLQAFATLASVIGIFLGKYLVFVFFLREEVARAYGTAAAARVSAFDGLTFSEFVDATKDTASGLWSGSDLLWAALAVYAAWRIPKALPLRKRQLAARTPFG